MTDFLISLFLWTGLLCWVVIAVLAVGLVLDRLVWVWFRGGWTR